MKTGGCPTGKITSLAQAFKLMTSTPKSALTFALKTFQRVKILDKTCIWFS